MAKKGNGVNRREFMQSLSGMVALGGGLFFMGSVHTATQEVKEALAPLGSAWRPDTPQRLGETTHALARRALIGEHGGSMIHADFSVPPQQLLGQSADMRYGLATKTVAEKAPLRILPGEKVIGSATLLEAPAHVAPVANVLSTSHTTPGFHRVLKLGYNGLRKEIQARLDRGDLESEPVQTVTAPGRHGDAFRAHPGMAYWAEALHKPEYETPPLTVECWAQVYSKHGFNVLALNRNKESRLHWEIYSFAETGYFSVYMPGYAPDTVQSDRDITDGQWHHLAMTFDGRRVQLFVDGDRVADQTVTPVDGLGDGQEMFYIGGYPPHSIPCDALIDELRISNTIRSFDDVPAEPLVADETTVALWRIEHRDGKSVLADASPLDNTAYPIISKRGRDVLEAMLLCLDGADIWRQRHLDELDRLAAQSTGDERENYLRLTKILERVPNEPPETFEEAVQSLWFIYAYQRLMGNWFGIGRIDEMLGPYLEKDLAEGRITLDEARELLAHFWVKGCEWIGAFETRGTGDAQHYQNILLAGVDAEGREVANDVTRLVLEVVEELHISDFPIAIRVNCNTPRWVLEQAARVQRHGGGIVAIYNEDVVIEGLTKFGYPLEEARTFTNDGCWEVLIPGRTAFSYAPFDGLIMLHEVLGLLDDEGATLDYPDFESLYQAYCIRLQQHIDHHHAGADHFMRGGQPLPMTSMLYEDCIERARGYYDRGPRYTVLAPHIGRVANIANSLYAIKRLVYDEEYLTLPELVEILRNDWEGHEQLRRLIHDRFTFYGNDHDDTDAMVVRLVNDYADMVWQVPEREGVLRPAGISTFGREIDWSLEPNHNKATADGHHVGAVLATNLSPSPGTDQKGPTAVINSFCKIDYTRIPNGATLELKVHPESVKGEQGINTLVALMQGFVQQGGFFLHIDVQDTALLLDAQRHPEKYPNLSVRIAGWSARFATLNKHWQDMIIGRTQQYV